MPVIQYKKEPKLNRIVDWDCLSIDLFTDSDTILITSLFAMHCGLSVVYEIQNKELLQEKTRLKEEKLWRKKKITWFYSIFSSQLVYQMGINDRCAVGACKNARKYPERYVIKPHIAAFNTSLSLHFWKCSDPKLYPKWTFACNRKNFKFGKNNYICSNHFQYGRPTGVNCIQDTFK